MSNVTQTVHEDGTTVYRNEAGEYHREDGPAVEFPHGAKHWYQNGKKHREGGPAAIWGDGSEFWFLNGQRHREDGPATVVNHGVKSWYLSNNFVTESKSPFVLSLVDSMGEDGAEDFLVQVVLPSFRSGLRLEQRHAEWLLENLEDARSLPSSWLREVLKGL